MDWYRPGEAGRWCSLQRVVLDGIVDGGVYVIWHRGRPARVVSVGQGPIGRRLAMERRDSGVLFYERFGTLCVSWAAAPARHRDGIERYLVEMLKPLCGGRRLKAKAIPVNMPWDAALPSASAKPLGLNLFRPFA